MDFLKTMQGILDSMNGESDNTALYVVGKEPEELKEHLDSYFKKLDVAYPNKTVEGLHSKHKKLQKETTDLYRKLGFKDNRSFLEAYGYSIKKYNKEEAEEPVKPKQVVNALRAKVNSGETYYSLKELKEKNPELLTKIRNVESKSKKEFGMTFGKYLIEQGIISTEVPPVEQVEEPVVEEPKEIEIKEIEETENTVSNEIPIPVVVEIPIPEPIQIEEPEEETTIEEQLEETPKKNVVVIKIPRKEKEKKKEDFEITEDIEKAGKYLFDIKRRLDGNKYPGSVEEISKEFPDIDWDFIKNVAIDNNLSLESFLIKTNVLMSKKEYREYVDTILLKDYEYAIDLLIDLKERVDEALIEDGDYFEPTITEDSKLCLLSNDFREVNVEIARSFIRRLNIDCFSNEKDSFFETVLIEMVNSVAEEKEYQFGGQTGAIYELILAIACGVFLTPDIDLHYKWARDQWEYNKDHIAKYQISFIIDEKNVEGCVKKIYND